MACNDESSDRRAMGFVYILISNDIVCVGNSEANLTCVEA